jgi:hypothetical protein
MKRAYFFTYGSAIVLLVLGIGLAFAGCLLSSEDKEDSTVQPPDKTADIVKEPSGPIQVDILWVIDGSAGMCQEMLALGRGADAFIMKLQEGANFDLRMAVTTMDGFGDGARGKFNNTAATTFPPACFETRVHPCLGNEDCQKRFGPGWDCKSYPADDMYNMNRSINSYCIYRCKTDGDCCGEFCYEDKCGSDQSCLLTKCDGAPTDNCTFECQTPGQGTSGSGCLQPPDTNDCPSSVPPVLSMHILDLFKCNATVESPQNFTPNLEQGLRTAWLALDPDGENAAQATGFLRPEALLLIIFVTDEDDCSVHENFASPNFECNTDDDCYDGAGICKTDVYFSKKMGKQIKLCEGVIKKDYFNICSLLGEFEGDTHHSCVYDLDCRDCETDSECDYGWHCKQDKKCRPSIYSLSNIATYQTPPGTPINALSPVAEFHYRFKSLKSDSSRVLVGAIIGDAIPVEPGGKENEPEQDSLLSSACVENEKLLSCQDYIAATQTVSNECANDPQTEGCEEFFEIKRKCIRECYLASKGDPLNPNIAKNSYICASSLGKADYGSRYFKLTQMFGANGVATNICSPEGIPGALDSIADRLLEVATPQPPQ